MSCTRVFKKSVCIQCSTSAHPGISDTDCCNSSCRTVWMRLSVRPNCPAKMFRGISTAVLAVEDEATFLLEPCKNGTLQESVSSQATAGNIRHLLFLFRVVLSLYIYIKKKSEVRWQSKTLTPGQATPLQSDVIQSFTMVGVVLCNSRNYTQAIRSSLGIVPSWTRVPTISKSQKSLLTLRTMGSAHI